MLDKCFLDANILVYANDKFGKDKSVISQEIIFELLEKDKGVVSAQVLNEFFVVVTQKIERTISVDLAEKEIVQFCSFEVVELDENMTLKAIGLSRKHRLSFWDALIIAAAAHADCALIYSEDFSDGRIIDGIKIKNPFV